MIIAERKPFNEISGWIQNYRRVLVVGCGTCVAVCLAGGEKEAGLLAEQLGIAAGLAGREQVFTQACVERQCDREFLAELTGQVREVDAVISLACGAGVGLMAELFTDTPVLAGVNTTFIGINDDVGVWQERCRACNDCLLSLTGGICPVALCPKSMLNGPCGGDLDGKCEADPERECVWVGIYRRLEGTGRLEQLGAVVGPRDHSARHLPGRQTHPAYERRYTAHD